MKYLYLILLLLISTSCSQTIEKENIISVSIAPLKFFVDEICDGDFEVNVLVPDGASAETYEPTPTAIKNVAKSKAFISVGLLDTEINIINYFKDKNDIISVELHKNCNLLESNCACAHHEHNHSHSHTDMGKDIHIWISVQNSKSIAKDTYETLIMLNSDSLEKYKQNYEALLNSLNRVDSIFTSHKGKVNNVLVYHPFLGYIAEEYHFSQLSIEDEGKEPSAKRIKELIIEAKNKGIKTIFYQSQFPVSSVESIAKELSAKTVKIDPLEYNHIQNLVDIANSISNE